MRPFAATVSTAVLMAFTWSSPSFAAKPQPVAVEQWITAADNLPDASRLGLDGAVSVELAVSSEGRVTDCRVLKSSGHDMLDEHTCGLLSSRAQFRPATDGNGLPVSGTFSHTMVWQAVTNANWAANGLVRAEMVVDPASERATECVAEISGEISDHMEQMACFVLINQAKGILGTMAARPQRPFGAALVLAVYPEDAENLARTGIKDDWRQVGYTSATVVVSPGGQRSDCVMDETRGPSTLIFPICVPTPQFRYVPGKDGTGANAATQLRQEVVYYIEGSAGN